MDSQRVSGSIGIVFLIAVYAGLAMLFYDAEQGLAGFFSSWFFAFICISVGFLVVFSLLLYRALRKVQQQSTPELQPHADRKQPVKPK